MSYGFLINSDLMVSGHLTATGTLLTIPANKRFMGYISVHVYATTATTEEAIVTTAGTNVIPAPSSVLAHAKVNGLALTSLSDSDYQCPLVAAPSANAVTIELTLTGSGTGHATLVGFVY